MEHPPKESGDRTTSPRQPAPGRSAIAFASGLAAGYLWWLLMIQAPWWMPCVLNPLTGIVAAGASIGLPIASGLAALAAHRTVGWRSLGRAGLVYVITTAFTWPPISALAGLASMVV